MDQFGAEQTSLILAVEKTVTNKLEEVGDDLKENTKTFTDELRNLSEYKYSQHVLIFKIKFVRKRHGYRQRKLVDPCCGDLFIIQ